jgi:chemotaxis protein MotB
VQASKKGADKHEATIVKRGGGKHHDDEHGGAWKVAFADFCMALMALFLVLWLIAARDAQQVKTIVRDNTASGLLEGTGGKPEIKSSPAGSLIERFQLPKSNGGAQGPAAGAKANTSTTRTKYESPSELAALAHQLEKMSADAGLASNLATVITPDGLRVMLHDTDRQGMFVRGSPLPTARFAKLLRAMAPLFEKMENQMLIVGHTDSVQYTNAGPASYSNWSLSVNRALAARAELLVGGMRGETILQLVGMADRAPIDAAHPDASVNRRIELLILTSKQSAGMKAMFGTPAATEPLTQDASTSRTDDPALKDLRSQMAKKP